MSINAPITQHCCPGGAAVDDKAIAATRKLIDEAIAAKGRRAKLAALKGIRWEATGATAVQQQTVPVKIERLFVVPDKIRIDAELTIPNGGKVPVIVAVDGSSGYSRSGRISAPASRSSSISRRTTSAPIEFERWREVELILLKASEKTAVIKPQPDEALDGKPHFVFKLESPFDKLDVSIYIDKASKQISRISYTDGKITNVDREFRQLQGGGQHPGHAHHRVQSAGGRVTTLDIGKYEIDPTVSPDRFKKPAAPPVIAAGSLADWRRSGRRRRRRRPCRCRCRDLAREIVHEVGIE